MNDRVIKDAWLDVDVDEDSLFKPLSYIRSGDPDEFQLRLAWLFMQPEYFSFAAKEVFNIEVLPMQALILKELWGRRFPMLVGSRGLGKSFVLSLYAMMRAFLCRVEKSLSWAQRLDSQKYCLSIWTPYGAMLPS